jgi:sortase A
MTLSIRCKPLTCALRCLQISLLAIAVSLLAYCGFVVVDARMFQAVEIRHLSAAAEKPTSLLAPGPEGLIGRIDISRLGISVIVVEGTSGAILRRAAGHIPGTALPGEAGNIGISAHRDTFFRPLRNVRRDDLITLATPSREYRYRVLSTEVVSPSDVTVLASDGNEILTLVTCFPFYFIGPAPKRFIVRAERVGSSAEMD